MPNPSAYAWDGSSQICNASLSAAIFVFDSSRPACAGGFAGKVPLVFDFPSWVGGGDSMGEVSRAWHRDKCSLPCEDSHRGNAIAAIRRAKEIWGDDVSIPAARKINCASMKRSILDAKAMSVSPVASDADSIHLFCFVALSINDLHLFKSYLGQK